MLKLYLISILIVACLSECPEWSCTDALEENECVQYVDELNIHVNYDKCTVGGCSYSKVALWTLTADKDDIYYCKTDDVWNEVDPADESEMDCGGKDQNKDLESGSYPKECLNVGEVNDSCKLTDGTYNECECGLDEKSYRVPDISSEIYDDYWNECNDNDGRLKSWSHYWFWTLKKLYYIDYITGFTCARDIFEEFNKIDDLDYTDNSGVFLALGVALLSLII